MDFEAALHINPQHQNAKKYLCETLIAVARNYEDDSKVGEGASSDYILFLFRRPVFLDPSRCVLPLEYFIPTALGSPTMVLSVNYSQSNNV